MINVSFAKFGHSHVMYVKRRGHSLKNDYGNVYDSIERENLNHTACRTIHRLRKEGWEIQFVKPFNLNNFIGIDN